MSVARVTEITSASSKSFDDAIREGLARANKTLENVTGTWIKDQEVVAKNGNIYRIPGADENQLCAQGLRRRRRSLRPRAVICPCA
jgi:flavin-binding protein dodecin